MSEKLREAVSAAIDDEADEFELRRVLDEVQKDPQLKATWERYHLVGSVLRDEHRSMDTSLREQVWAELSLAEEDAAPVVLSEVQESGSSGKGSRLNRLTGIAVAATVALAVTLVGVNLTDSTPDSAPVIASVQTAPTTSPAGTTPESSGALSEQRAFSEQGALSEQRAFSDQGALSGQGDVSDQDEARTAALMLAHAQNLGMNQPGLAAFTKMVTYQRR